VLPVAAAAGGARLDAPTVAAALAGRYDNVAQVEAERRSGVAAAHEPLALTITPVTAPLVADVVLFVQEGAADDPRRVFSQRIWVLGADARRHVLHGVYRVAEPERWRAGAGNRKFRRCWCAISSRSRLRRALEPRGWWPARVNDAAQCRWRTPVAATASRARRAAGSTLAFSAR
jgi:hypothetical protein